MRDLIKQHGDIGFVVACVIKYKSKQAHGPMWVVPRNYSTVFRKAGVQSAVAENNHTFFYWNGNDDCILGLIPEDLLSWWIRMQRGSQYSWSEMAQIQRMHPSAQFVAYQLIK